MYSGYILKFPFMTTGDYIPDTTREERWAFDPFARLRLWPRRPHVTEIRGTLTGSASGPVSRPSGGAQGTKPDVPPYLHYMEFPWTLLQSSGAGTGHIVNTRIQTGWLSNKLLSLPGYTREWHATLGAGRDRIFRASPVYSEIPLQSLV